MPTNKRRKKVHRKTGPAAGPSAHRNGYTCPGPNLSPVVPCPGIPRCRIYRLIIITRKAWSWAKTKKQQLEKSPFLKVVCQLPQQKLNNETAGCKRWLHARACIKINHWNRYTTDKEDFSPFFIIVEVISSLGVIRKIDFLKAYKITSLQRSHAIN